MEAQEPASPRVTVLVPVRNGQRWIRESLVSLATQTYRDFEILLIDDGCTDSSLEIAESMGIPELRVTKGPEQGLARALSQGVVESRGSLIARQDADDISEPNRLERQVRHLDEHPNCVAVGSWAREISESGTVTGILKAPVNDRAARVRALLFSPLIHPSVMMRRSVVLSVGNYQSPGTAPYAEDYDLWSRLLQVGVIHSLPETLIRYRQSAMGITTTGAKEIAESSSHIAAANLARSLGSFTPTVQDEMLLSGFYQRLRDVSISDSLTTVRRLIQARLTFGLRPATHGLPWRAYVAPLLWVLPSFSTDGASE